MRDYSWISEMALEAKNYSPSLGTYFAKAISKVSFDPISEQERRHAWTAITRDIIQLSLDPEFEEPKDVAETMLALQTIGIDQFNNELVNESKLSPVITNLLNQIFDSIGQHPGVLDFIEEAHLIEDIFDTITKRFFPMMRLFPIFSKEAIGIIPYLREPLFTAFYELPDLEHHRLIQLTERFLHTLYKKEVRPKLEKILSNNIKGQNLLLPLIDGAIEHLPPDKCMTAIISILCTPKEELTQGRIISIVLQELGGIYVKLAQVLSELAPPVLSKELKHQQDKLGGIFGSQKKSWNYVLEIFRRPSWAQLKDYIEIPDQIQNAYAGASVGAIYEFELSPFGKRTLNSKKAVLIKVRRPGLLQLFESQKEVLISILNHLEQILPNTELNIDQQLEIKGLITALKRTIINYASQTIEELDFRLEKRNAEKIEKAFKDKFYLDIPDYYHVEEDVLVMEKLDGEKITSVVHSRYLERVGISDTISDAYLYLMFQKGIIWADPHAGNILYDPTKHKVKLIDLNPCFSWDEKTIKIFIGFLYRLILSDHKGIFEGLSHLIEDPNELKNERNQKIIKNFISSGNQGSFMRYLSDFIQTLGKGNINLKIEVQAALRGISQIYITANAISSRNNFGQIFQKQFGWRILFGHILSIGPFKVLRASLPLAFDWVKNSPEEEVGPSLDERDISAIEDAINLLNHENVCQIELQRMSPEENTKLILSTDGSRLIKSAYLKIEILTETKPASVRYIIEVPDKDWLRERQEYIKLQGMGFVLCLVECLEQLRRHSLEDYWNVVEGWNKRALKRTYKESNLIGEVRVAARNLFVRRYNQIWKSELMTVSAWNRFLWKLLIQLEERFEKKESSYFYFLSKKMGHEKVGQYTFGTIHRIKIIGYRLIIQGIKTFIRSSKFEMNLLPLTTDQLIDRMIYGLLRRGLHGKK